MLLRAFSALQFTRNDDDGNNNGMYLFRTSRTLAGPGADFYAGPYINIFFLRQAKKLFLGRSSTRTTWFSISHNTSKNFFFLPCGYYIRSSKASTTTLFSHWHADRLFNPAKGAGNPSSCPFFPDLPSALRAIDSWGPDDEVPYPEPY